VGLGDGVNAELIALILALKFESKLQGMNNKNFGGIGGREGRGSLHCQHMFGNLAGMFESYLQNPTLDYTLRCGESNEGRVGFPQGKDFQEGYNPLDQWIQSQLQNNKENMGDTQLKRQSINEMSAKFGNAVVGNKKVVGLQQ
jgi:hypothetical protein